MREIEAIVIKVAAGESADDKRTPARRAAAR
jgi:hypothetical protein